VSKEHDKYKRECEDIINNTDEKTQTAFLDYMTFCFDFDFVNVPGFEDCFSSIGDGCDTASEFINLVAGTHPFLLYDYIKENCGGHIENMTQLVAEFKTLKSELTTKDQELKAALERVKELEKLLLEARAYIGEGPYQDDLDKRIMETLKETKDK